MKSIYLLLIVGLLTFSFEAEALGPQENAVLFEHLSEVNKEWRKQQVEEFHKIHASFSNDIERIQMHLQLVEQNLLTVKTEHLNEDQRLKRQEMLDVLNSYWKAGKFPQNHYHQKRQPYFIDNHGTACAVGYLIIASGNGQLAEKVHKENNYAYIKELAYPELFTWANEHGFTIDELAWIQPGYQPKENWQVVGGGVDGEVEHIAGFGEKMVIAGKFEKAGETTAKNIAIWNGQEYEALGDGLEGDISQVHCPNNSIIKAYGRFSSNDKYYEIATWNGNSWQYENVFPYRTGAITAVNKFDNYIGGWIKKNDSTIFYVAHQKHNSKIWNVIGFFNGKINAINHYYFGLAVGGEFTLINDTISAAYVAEYVDNYYQSSLWQQLGGGLDAPVFTLESNSPSLILYAGGSMFVDDKPTFGAARFLNGDWQRLLHPNYYGVVHNGKKVNAIKSYNDGLLIAGKFDFVPLIGQHGSNIAFIDFKTGFVTYKADLDAPVKEIYVKDDKIYAGGNFTGHFIMVDETNTSIEPGKNFTKSSVYPNPFSESARLVLDGVQLSSATELRLYNMQGQQVSISSDRSGNAFTLARGNLASGVYFYRVSDNGRLISTGKIAVQ